MNYKKLANEVYKLYRTFFDVFFDRDQAFELTKFCVKEFPMFKEMIEEDQEDQYL